MKITLLTVGPTRTDYIKTGIKLYTERLRHYIPTEIVELPDIRNTRALTEHQQKEREAAGLLGALQPGDKLMLLDERGREYTSREFAAMIERNSVQGTRRLVFAVGGPYGFARDVYDRADGQISFSRMTFPHELIRLFFAEQVYRAMTIIRNEPYHHD